MKEIPQPWNHALFNYTITELVDKWEIVDKLLAVVKETPQPLDKALVKYTLMELVDKW